MGRPVTAVCLRIVTPVRMILGTVRLEASPVRRNVTLESTLSNWTAPSSSSEAEKQERTLRMIRGAITTHRAFDGYSVQVYAKGSYPNNTNVRLDSDVDTAVQIEREGGIFYFEETEEGLVHRVTYDGIWTPARLRAETEAALQAEFGTQVDTSGRTAIGVNSSTARVDADVTPCFDYRYYYGNQRYHEGIRIYRNDGSEVENYPAQHLKNGIEKNTATSLRYKRAVRILKNLANAMSEEGYHREVPSYFIECLVYNCPNHLFDALTWTNRVTGILAHIWGQLEGPEPTDGSARWVEVNGIKFLFHDATQKWRRSDARDFAAAAWNYLKLG